MKLKADVMERAADRAGELLKALANRHRLLILCHLIEKERSVGELAEFLGIRDSGVSQHLALLRKDGLVSARRDGQTIWYSIASGEARALLEALYDIYCGPVAACEPKPTRKRRVEKGQ
jgi:DNA-binding transcriptional ArsR family regulator